MTKLKETLDKEVEELRRVRDQLKVQAHLGKAEFKDAWARLEAHWPKVEEKLKKLESETSEFKDELLESAKDLVEEIRQGYLRMRR